MMNIMLAFVLFLLYLLLCVAAVVGYSDVWHRVPGIQWSGCGRTLCYGCSGASLGGQRPWTSMCNSTRLG